MKESLPKSGRWFSWMECAHAMLQRVVGKSHYFVEWYLGIDVPDPDECVMGKFEDLRVGKGGLKLVHAVLSCSNWENCHILLACNRPLWDWYTVQVTELKTAHDAVDYAIYMSTQWRHDEQFFKLASEWSCNRKFVSRSLATVDLLCFLSGYCLLCLHCKLDALKSLKATVL